MSALERIGDVIASAERAAAEIHAAAEARAQRELEDARREIDAMTRERVAAVSELTEAMIEHATLVAGQCESLIRTLEATMQRLGGPDASPLPTATAPPQPVQGGQNAPRQFDPPWGAPPPPPPPPAPPPPVAPPPVAQPGAADDPPATATADSNVPDDAYVRATQLALEGWSRVEIGARITAEFGVADPEPVLNQVLGQG